MDLLKKERAETKILLEKQQADEQAHPTHYTDAYSRAVTAYHQAARECDLQRKIALAHQGRLWEASAVLRVAHEELIAWAKRTTP